MSRFVTISITILLLLAYEGRTHVIPAYGVTVGLAPYNHPVQSLYHAQDIHGQYIYGYATPTATKTETKTADGVTRGGYSYIDSHGVLQSVEYVADPAHGFRVAATNLPQDLPDVAYAKAKHLSEFETIKSEHLAARTVQYSNPVAVPINAVPILQPVQDLPEVAAAKARHLAQYEAIKAQHLAAVQIPVQPPAQIHDLPEVIKARAEHLAAVEATKARDLAAATQHQFAGPSISPVTYQTGSYVVPVRAPQIVAAPVIAKQPVVAYAPILHQYQAQDGYGQYSYGYTGPWSSKSETKSPDGVVRGGYSYIDGNGVLQTVHYVADAHGFRVAGTNIPVGPESYVQNPSQPNHDAQKLYSHDITY
nr:uncharacterized protein LOC111427588 [Onthophagus taurus]